MNGPAGALVLLGLAACAAVPPAPGPEPATHAGRVCVRIVFEPPLAEPGWLTVEHESGARERVPAPRTGVELWLPPGPASLRLEANGIVCARPIAVDYAGAELTWLWKQDR